MKILYLLQDFPHPPTNGVHLTPHNLIKVIARSNQCVVLSFGSRVSGKRIREWESSVPGLEVRSVHEVNTGLGLFYRRLRSGAAREPMSMARWASERFRLSLRETIATEEFDIVHIDMVNLTQYLPEVAGIPVVCSLNDSSSRLHPQMASLASSRLVSLAWRLRGRRLRKAETRAAERATIVRLVSEVDARYLRDLVPSADIEVIGVAIDEHLFDIPLATDRPQNPVIFSAGHMNTAMTARSMVGFIEQEFPRVRSVVSGAELQVLTRDPDASLVRACSRAAGVSLHTWVEDYTKTLAGCGVALFLDLAGTGMKNRVVQAMGAGRAVVGTPVAFESIPVLHGQSGLVCRSLREAGDQVIAVLENAATQRRLSENARAIAGEHFHPDVVGGKWQRLYQRAVQDHRS